ncbi:MAG: DUF6520 family protein [Cytophagales bacterium]|nr:DUF6520 family protein [Cytophagales bacterium]
MKNLKSVLAALAFVFAFGAAFAIQPNTANDVFARKTSGGICENITECSTIENLACDVSVFDGFYPTQGCSGSKVTAYLRP